jgi:tRNA threonylcarbamoyladenosine biosynthesis protein TsaE
MQLTTESAEETIELGQKIGQYLQGGEVILLSGSLGGGKTQFTKGIGQGLGITEEIISPTFTIERIYNGRLTLHHFDFYRLNGFDAELLEELDEISKQENNVTVIEWPDNLKYQPTESLQIHFHYLDENRRQLRLDARGGRYEKLLEVL